MLARIVRFHNVSLAGWSDRRVRYALGAVLVIVFSLAALKYFAKANKPSDLGTYTRTAFLRWRPQVLDLDRGINIYQAYAYPNPPIMALILRPLYALPPLTGAMAWYVLKVGMALAMYAWVFRMLRSREWQGRFWPVGVLVLTFAFSLHPVLGDLTHGNVNLLIGFLVIAALWAYCQRREFLGGTLLALAIACKVTPALFIPYFAWKRAWGMLAGTAFGLVLWLAVIPSATLGYERNQELLTGWFDAMVRPFVIDGKVTSEHPNQSIPGLAFRLLTDEPSFVAYDETDRPYGAEFHNLVAWPADRVRMLVKGIMLAYGVMILVVCRYPSSSNGSPRRGLALAAEFSLIALGMLLFSERTWKHHSVMFMLPYAVIAVQLASQPGPRLRAFLIGVLAITGVCMAGPSLFGGEIQDLALVYGSHTVVFVSLALAMAVIAWSQRPQEVMPTGHIPPAGPSLSAS